MTAFGDPGREIEVSKPHDQLDSTPGTLRVRTRAGNQIGLWLKGAAVSVVQVDIPNPVPPRIEVRVPAIDDPRLNDPVLLVVDEKSGKPLPTAILDPGPKAPEELPVHADAAGHIRVPRVLAERISVYPLLGASGIVSERDHVPSAWRSIIGMNNATLADWAAWDASGAMRVGLEPLPTDPQTPRRKLRILDENGNSRAGCLVLLRTPDIEMRLQPPHPARADGSGIVEVMAPAVASYDIYDGPHLVGTFVLSLGGMPEDRPRSIRIPKAVQVHVIVRGLSEPKPSALLHGPDVVSLAPDDETGWTRIDGRDQPGWMAFTRAAGVVIQVSEGLPAEMDVWLPRGRPVALNVAGREAVLKADGPTTIELDWTMLPPPPEGSGDLQWDLTREGLHEALSRPLGGIRLGGR